MKISHLLLLGLLYSSLAHSASFEPPQYQDGQSLSEQEGWKGEGGVQITTSEAQEGSQSVVISSGNNLSRKLVGSGISYVDLCILPEFVESPDEPTLQVAGIELGFVRHEAGNSVAIFQKNEIVLLPLTGFVAPSKTQPGSRWVRVTVRIDSAQKIADLYVNGLPALANLPLGKQPSIFELTTTPESVAFLDSWSESPENPLFPDADHDGMPDAEEKALGLNAYGDDRNGDLDGDGISNVQEFFNGSSPTIGGSAAHLSRGVILYVDNLNGNDANAGLHSYQSLGLNGPKASLKSAMEAAPTGSTIAVLKGTGIYKEGSRGAEGKKLTIKAVGPVTIQ